MEMENKNVLNNEDLAQVSGGGEISVVEYVHRNCGGHVSCENNGTNNLDVQLKCEKCGKRWSPQDPNNIREDSGIFTVEMGTF